MKRSHSLFSRPTAFAFLVLASWGVPQPSHAQDADHGYLLVPSWNDSSIYRYDAVTGVLVDRIAPNNDNDLVQPWACIFSPYDGDLLVSAGHFVRGRYIGALRFNGVTLDFIDEFTPKINESHAITFGPDGNLYIGQRITQDEGVISRFDGLTGEFLGDFVPLASGGLSHPTGHVFGPRGKGNRELDLYVADGPTGDILRYDGDTGEFLGVFVAGGTGGLAFPYGLVFGPDGDLYIANLEGAAAGVLRFEGPASRSPGAFVELLIPSGSGGLIQPFGLLFGPDANGDGDHDLYVNSQFINPHSFRTEKDTSSVKIYDGVSGDYIRDLVTVETSGGLEGPALMSFTASHPITLEYLGD